MTFLHRFLLDFDFNALRFVFDLLIPSLLAVIFGGLIGLQRERHERPAGLRTHALVCLGATVFTLVSYLGFSQSSGIDSSRIAAGVVTGIGFIGAGVIFRQGILIKGVTTAASIWISAAIGLALGTGLYYLAVIVTILGLIVLSFLKNLENRIIHVPFYTVNITTAGDFKELEELKDILKKISGGIKTKKYELSPGKDEKTYSFQVRGRTPDLAEKIIDLISKKEGVLKISIG
jgi:putative Mg2+ transporter-C (MgtC) family protein